jgi:hypothetical protein
MTELHAVLNNATKRLSALIGLLEPSLPDPTPRIAAFTDAACAVGPLDHYKVFPSGARRIAADIEQLAGADHRKLFLRAVLLQALIRTLDGAPFKRLPPRVAAFQARHLERIAAHADDRAEWLNINHDLFHKEFGLATLRLYAAGAQLVDYRCGVARSLMLKEGVLKAVPKLFAFVKLGGFRPYFQIHTHTFNLDAFHEAGWEDCYLCCAELYAIHPEVLGMFGSSWFYDPALAGISPRLAYLRDTPCAGGATLTFVQQGGEAINNALSTSPSRRKLYDEGKYVPTNYMLLWGKKAQIAWAGNRLASGCAAAA